jgi:hypothetical protein
MGEVHDIGTWRARKAAARDVEMGAPPFVLEEPCPGCGAERVGTMVWRMFRTSDSTEREVPFPRIEPHFLCCDGRVVHQEITDSPAPVTSWKQIFGRFRQEPACAR